MPRVKKYKTADKLYVDVYRLFKNLVKNSPRIVVALPTGNTPIPLYKLLSQDSSLDWSKVIIFMLDSYYPQDMLNPVSFLSYMKINLLNNINLPPENFHILKSDSDDPNLECQNYEEEISQAGGLDLAILGLGANCHIGFNEPGTPKDSPTHLVNLSPETLAANNPHNLANFPKQGLTMGIKTILSAKKILVLATGQKKALSVKRSLTETPSPKCPASFLQKHPDVTFVLDKEAGNLLR